MANSRRPKIQGVTKRELPAAEKEKVDAMARQRFRGSCNG